jgi:hypothetical protein
LAAVAIVTGNVVALVLVWLIRDGMGTSVSERSQSASSWGFAVYLASRDGYEDSVLPSGHFLGSPEEALDCAPGLYLAAADTWRIGGPDGPG